MAGSPQFKIYTASNEYIASAKYAEDAACLVALRGDGATVRWGHSYKIWTEGREAQPAGESFDFAAGVMRTRLGGLQLASHRLRFKGRG